MAVDPERDDDIAEHDINPLAAQFAVELVELADRYDSLDHEAGPVGGSELQNYCNAVRLLARSIVKVESEYQVESPEATS